MDSVPSVTQQGYDVARVGNTPNERNYNSGMLEIDGVVYLATRQFHGGEYRCRLVINRLNKGAKASPVTVLDLPRPVDREMFEDGRLFMFNGKIHLAYTEGQYYTNPNRSVQKLAILSNKWAVEKVITIGFGQNSVGSEKNWQFFVHQDRLHFIYSISPHVVCELDGDYRVVKTHSTSTPISWQFGTLSGGTPPIKVGNRFISFLHSYTLHPTRHRRYSFSAYEFDAAEPFTITRLTTPMVKASAEDLSLPNPSVPHWQPLVIFPCGALLDKGTWRISAGVNDSSDVIISLTQAKLESLLKPIADFKDPQPRYFFKESGATKPVRLGENFVAWRRAKGSNPTLGVNLGILESLDAGVAEIVLEMSEVKEISKDEYTALLTG